MSRTILVFITLALCLSTADTLQAMIGPFSWRVIRGLAQSSEVLVLGSVISEEVGRSGMEGPDGFWIPTTDTRLRVRVNKTLVGHTAPEIDVLSSGTISYPQGDLLLFLRRDGDSFRMSSWSIHGVFGVSRGRVVLWLQGAKQGYHHPVATFTKLMRREQRRRVTWKADIAPAGKRDVALTFTFRNTGRLETTVLPPSWAFNCLIVRRLREKKWRSSHDPLMSVDHWEFLKRAEQPVKLAAGEAHTFRYAVPRHRLGIKARGEYEVTVRLKPYRTSRWCKEDKILDQASVWLGVSPVQKLHFPG